MKGKRRTSIGSHERDDDWKEFELEHLEVEPVLGDVMWVRRYDDGLWWPAVVVDDNNISASSKPRNRSMGDVLVRLYGSYQYFYADPVKCRSEFEITLKENGGCYHEMFVEALEQDLPRSKSGRSKGKGSNSKGTSNGRASASKDKSSNQNRVNCKRESSTHARVSPRKQINANTPVRKTKDDNFLSKIVEEAISKASNQDVLEKELKFDSPNTKGNSKGTPKQDGMRNKLKRNCTSTNGQAQTKTPDQAEKKRLKRNSQSAAADTNYQSPEKDEEREKHELSPSSGGGTFFGRLQELRRTKVMQTLGLVAPSGLDSIPSLKEDAFDSEDPYWLLYCSKKGDKEGVLKELDKGVEPNLADYDKRTALRLAPCECRTEVGHTPLSDAPSFGYQDNCKILETRGGVDPVGLESETPICYKINFSEVVIDGATLVGEGSYDEVYFVKWGGKKGRLDQQTTAAYVLDIARGKFWITPRNVLQDESGHLKVTDFSLSKIAHEKDAQIYKMTGGVGSYSGI
ncbi:unnamed protein product [Dovyalis caffra]|uniref:PWWP domain-containing protein n=1 Tax=Dovyalis caffra TaxID=77055 RepID=A0AAV1S8L6_9ROSI|nr:unnamed protein product [Dovyalis caffra]